MLDLNICKSILIIFISLALRHVFSTSSQCPYRKQWSINGTGVFQFFNSLKFLIHLAWGKGREEAFPLKVGQKHGASVILLPTGALSEKKRRGITTIILHPACSLQPGPSQGSAWALTKALILSYWLVLYTTFPPLLSSIMLCALPLACLHTMACWDCRCVWIRVSVKRTAGHGLVLLRWTC